MAKGPYLNEDVRLRIARIANEHREWKAVAVRGALLKELAGGDGVYERDWPSQSTIEKELRNLRPKNGQQVVDELDRPWSLAALARYEIPPDVLPIVMEAWARRLADGTPLTIRQVTWIARLSHIVSELPILIHFACDYASIEPAVWRDGRYPVSLKALDGLLWAQDSRTYAQKESHDLDVERKLCEKYLQRHSSTGAGGTVLVFKHPLVEEGDERNNDAKA